DKNVFKSLPEVGAFASDPPKARAVLAAWLKPKTKLELAEWAWSADIHLGTVNTTRDIVAHPQLAARDYWTKVGEYVVPGPAVRFSRTPIVLARPAPALGADEAFADAWLADPVRPEPARPEPGRREGREGPQTPRLGEAFAGLRVVDFSWVAVGPLTTKALADHGATVVRVESSTRVDYLRTLTPFKDDVVGINRSHYYNNVNTSKLGVALNFATPGGLALARRLAAWADVVIENFTPGTMKRLGLDYETLSRGRPELIMLSTCLMGQTGPWASFAGYGPHGAAIAGLHAITGWPDRAPCGPNGPYTDVIAPHYSIAALSAAILERRKSGLGQYIDMSQIEAALHFIEPLLLDETVNGRTATAQGLDSPTACPHGVYATHGSERYIAIAVETPAQWRALRSLTPLDAFADARYDAFEARYASRDAIDAALSAWTAEHEPFELEARLIEAGVPASVVQRMTDLHDDPQLAARGFFVPLRHSEVGELPYDGLITRFSAKQRMLHKASPCLGEDTDYVLRELLGLTPDEIADYAAQDVFV
ncbi:MAG TPA: CoA transferase, partial [Dehalococcoidia bacterium]|nr:CoA transferase [Dehalococcoidia bacterium]